MKPVLASVNALWYKAEREAYRSFHAKSKDHKADHFFNFCISAHALRDFFLEQKAIPPGPARRPFHQVWDADPLLVAVKEIANLSKHFQLRVKGSGAPRRAQTRRVVHRLGKEWQVFITEAGAITTIAKPSREIVITLSDGSRYDLWEFSIDVLDTWRVFLRGHGIRVHRQPGHKFHDRAPSA